MYICELCNWEIRTIISYLIPNTLRPQHSFQPVQPFLSVIGSDEGGGPINKCIPSFHSSLKRQLNCWLVIRLQLVKGTIQLRQLPAAKKISPLVGGYMGPVPSFFRKWVFYFTLVLDKCCMTYNANIFRTSSPGNSRHQNLRFVLTFTVSSFVVLYVLGIKKTKQTHRA